MTRFTIDDLRLTIGSVRRMPFVVLFAVLILGISTFAFAGDDKELTPGVVQCANLIYANNKSSVCFSSKFMDQIEQQTNVITSGKFSPVQVDSAELYKYPFAVMTGEGAFRLTQPQRDSLRDYLMNGGFLVASAGCSGTPWGESFMQEIQQVFPDLRMIDLPFDHPVFHTVFEISRLPTSHGHADAKLKGLEIDGKIVLVFSADGLNDTANAGGKCCCCGGAEVQNARQVNVNLLAYALTH